MLSVIKKQYCPICKKEVRLNVRYPRYICSDCAQNPVDEFGEKLFFCNSSLAGGFEARYKGSNQTTGEHICYVAGIMCYADEARFGGIVIQTCD